MAEERNLATARATEDETLTDADATKEELQRRMDEARESISQTVTEIKETVVSQYQNVRESINDTLDWREQYRRHTIPLTIGAVGVGACLGYSVAGVIFGRGDDDDYDEVDDYAQDETQLLPAPRAYVSQPVLGRAASASARSAQSLSAESAGVSDYSTDAGLGSGPAYASAGDPQALASQESEPDKPSLLSRFRETKAYDRLQDELGTLGDRAVEELSKTAQAVILPAILGKLKDLIGIDLGTQREVAQRTQLEQQAAKASAATATASTGAPGNTPTGGSGL